MDGRGQWCDNVFVERLWKSLEYEEVYLKAYESVSAARAQIGRYLAFYNARRPHRAQEGKRRTRSTSVRWHSCVRRPERCAGSLLMQILD